MRIPNSGMNRLPVLHARGRSMPYVSLILCFTVLRDITPETIPHFAFRIPNFPTHDRPRHLLLVPRCCRGARA